MPRRTTYYDLLSASLVLGSLVFFYQATQFLVGKDYVAAGVATFIGILIIRVGVELAKLSLLVRRREREKGGR